ncbi:hypothetical protein KHA93_01190 [Bacillus sp. FJAT-49732]|uniref:Uncharacterized protein n=2 Tax=Lederbergia citrisecunda TaxID=2833583 RepID=A0A942YJM5_9BACI|nr:hypothetical protein [Lederbergia citrisecunda]MBS4198274.1 hypothetical protein [Lederbergia citrisecunda]
MGDYDFNDFVELKVDEQYVMHLFKTEEFKPMEKANFVFKAEDIVKAHKQLIEKHVDVEPIFHHEDHAGFNFKDSDGNILMICKYFYYYVNGFPLFGTKLVRYKHYKRIKKLIYNKF